MRPADSPFIQKTRALGRDRNSEFGASAYRLCKGVGLEFGAVNCPFDVDAEVMYLDQVPEPVLLERHKNDPNVTDVIPLTFVAPVMPYPFIADRAFDFNWFSRSDTVVPELAATLTVDWTRCRDWVTEVRALDWARWFWAMAKMAPLSWASETARPVLTWFWAT